MIKGSLILIQDQFGIIQRLQTSPIPQISILTETLFCHFLQQSGSRLLRLIVIRIETCVLRWLKFSSYVIRAYSRKKLETLGFSFLQFKLYFMTVFFRYKMDYSLCCLSVFIFVIRTQESAFNCTAYIKEYSSLGYDLLVRRWCKNLLGNSISPRKKV